MVNKLSNANESVVESVKDWATNDFAPIIESYIVEEFAPEVQNWICEEFAPEVQNWVCEEFAPEVESWIVEEYSPMIESYLTEEFAPTVEGWITEEFVPVVDKWINEECIKEHKESIINEVNNNVNAFMEAKKQESLSNIDNLLEAIEKKGQPDEALALLQEKQVDEKYKGVYVVENMPAEYMPRWTMLSEAKQQEIIARSKMYNFTKPGVLESFWSTVDFEEKQKQVNEGLETQDTYHANIFKSMAKLRRGF